MGAFDGAGAGAVASVLGVAADLGEGGGSGVVEDGGGCGGSGGDPAADRAERDGERQPVRVDTGVGGGLDDELSDGLVGDRVGVDFLAAAVGSVERRTARGPRWWVLIDL